MTFAFTPSDGYRNVASFPTKPANETVFRDSMQDLLDQLRDYNNNASSVQATLPGANQTVSAGVVTIVNFNTEIFDKSNDYDAATSTFTAPETGDYILTAGMNILTPPADTFGNVSFSVNSGGKDLLLYRGRLEDGMRVYSVTYHLNAGDTVRVVITGTTFNIVIEGLYPGTSFFIIARM